ncbi:7 transmembrane sweet-taste receptor of 3 GCPR-domain-containing protein [Zopfochytrium polystomum]|nr:7 transmembrane sweet-taste receptor of 3 GCPR-domain-containing protein [Zopfochytrium polystomum]
MCATMTALILAAFVVMGVNSSHAIVKAMSPVFVAVILAGMLALELMALSWIGDWTRWKCHVETFVLPGAFSLLMGALFIKNYRLYKIFNTPMVLKTGLSNIELILSTCAVVTPNLVLAIVWTVIAPKYPKLKTVNLGSGDFSSYYQCASDSPGTDKIILIVLYAYNALLVGATVWIAFVTRNIKAQLSETVYIGYSVYNAVATSVVLIPLLFAGMITDFTVLFWFRSIVLIYPVAFAFWIMFGKRILLDTWFADSTGKLKRTGNPFSMSTGSSGLRSSAESEVLIAKGESITSYVNVLHQTGAMSSWKRKYAHYKDDSGVITLFDKEVSPSKRMEIEVRSPSSVSLSHTR